VRGYLPGLFTESAPPELLEEAAAIMLDVRPAGMRAMIRSFADADLRDVLPGIRVPTLLLYGDADRRSPLGTVAAELHRMIPGSRLRILAGVGHAANLETPERFNAEVREFLGSVP
jgi:pimeloyl-ACP methyl ester carboxylesterase